MASCTPRAFSHAVQRGQQHAGPVLSCPVVSVASFLVGGWGQPTPGGQEMKVRGGHVSPAPRPPSLLAPRNGLQALAASAALAASPPVSLTWVRFPSSVLDGWELTSVGWPNHRFPSESLRFSRARFRVSGTQGAGCSAHEKHKCFPVRRLTNGIFFTGLLACSVTRWKLLIFAFLRLWFVGDWKRVSRDVNAWSRPAFF